MRKRDGWYRFITLALIAHAYLRVLRQHAAPWKEGELPASAPLTTEQTETLLPLTLAEVRRLLQGWVWELGPPEGQLLAWSRWRRQHQARARRCY